MNEKFLKIILRISGIMLIAAFGAVLLPYDIMNQIHQNFGLGSLPRAPILDYLARSVSMFYGIHGVIVLYISFDLVKYLKFLKLLCYLGFVFGITLFFIDINAPMPLYWSLSEGPFVIFLNGVIFFLAIQLERKKRGKSKK